MCVLSVIVDNVTYFHLLNEVGEHDNSTHIVVPHKPPEVTHCVWQRALCGYVLITAIVTLKDSR